MIRGLVDLALISRGLSKVFRESIRSQTNNRTINDKKRAPSQTSSSSSSSSVDSNDDEPSSSEKQLNETQLSSSSKDLQKRFKQSQNSQQYRNYSIRIHNHKNLGSLSEGSSSSEAYGNHNKRFKSDEVKKPAEDDNSDKSRKVSDHLVGSKISEQEEDFKKPLRSSKVPSTRLGRLFHYGGLAAGIGWGTASEAIKRSTSSKNNSDRNDDNDSLVLTEQNVRRLVDKLTKMRGAALKLGQFLSIQDAKILPPQIEEIFVKVQSTADSMPFSQTESVLSKELGANWRERFIKFEEEPFAAASIGQVHLATIKDRSSTSSAPIKVAVKVQFPGVYESISSDISYLSLISSSTLILPRGLFLNKTLEVLGKELKEECDYRRELECLKSMKGFVEGDESLRKKFEVPRGFNECCSKMVLSCEFMNGKSLSRAVRFNQDLRDQIGRDILELSLKEIFKFKLMQTDPNWSNFLWNDETKKIELIDFGATRSYSDEFVKDYLNLLKSGISEDREGCIEYSKKIGYLTGEETEEMLEAQFRTLKALGEPFRKLTDQPFDFKYQTITDRVKAEIPVMVRKRLKPPPIESYSLNRKLSGIFLLCSRLGSRIDCFELINQVLDEV